MSTLTAPSSFHYPETAREGFLESADIVLRDGTHISPEEVWDFLTRIGPERYPALYDVSKYYSRRISGDVTLPAILKNTYLHMTMDDRISRAKAKGTPVIFVQGGQSVDPYYAAGGIALRPASTGSWAIRRERGLTRNQEELIGRENKQKAYNEISFEICNSAGYERIQAGDLPVDMVAPFSCLRCSDVSYGLEAHRHGRRKDVKLQLVDYPLANQKDKPWAVEYFAENLRQLTRSINELSGKTTGAEELRREIKVHNEGRRLATEIADLWWSAEVPPTTGKDRRDLFQLGGMEMHGDPEASLSLLREIKGYLIERIKRGEKGIGVDPKAKRVFVCGSCVFPSDYRMEEAGAIIVGQDNHWSDITTLVEEEGDPFINLSKAVLSYPYEQPIKERARWTAEQIKKSRADGVLFLYKWGCNTQSAAARMLVDEIKASTGLPTLIIEDDMQANQTEQLQNRVNAFVEML
jgi:benzoyl-CoA reductase/2-hydroxyglutaryl-CoA dehydratase subunit BcrC/BadD/HgdB